MTSRDAHSLLPLRPVETLMLTMLAGGDRHGYAIRQEILEHTGGFESGMRRKLRFLKPLEAPAAITKIFGSTVTIEEHSEFSPSEQRWSFRMVPALLADRIDIRGVVHARESEGKVQQLATNTVTARLLGLGTIIEHFVAKATREGTADKTNFTRRYIAEKGLR